MKGGAEEVLALEGLAAGAGRMRAEIWEEKEWKRSATGEQSEEERATVRKGTIGDVAKRISAQLAKVGLENSCESLQSRVGGNQSWLGSELGPPASGDPGVEPGSGLLVNAEQGSMGGGAGAAATIENEPSPRRAAIEKIQAELRKEVAAREERRRELEFLEKGGEPLDFFSAPNTAILPVSPAGPLAEQLVSSDVESSYTAALANGDSLDDRLGTSIPVGSGGDDRHVGDDGACAAAEGLVSPWDAKVRVPRTGSASLRSQVDMNSKREDEAAGGGGRVGGKVQQYTRRIRQRTNRFGNGYTQSKEVEKPVESTSTSSYELKSQPAAPLLLPVEATKENESMVEKNLQPLAIHLALPNASGSRASVETAKAIDHDAGFPVVNISEQLPIEHALTDNRADVANADSKSDFEAADYSPAGPVAEQDVNTEANVNKDVQIDGVVSRKSDQLPAIISEQLPIQHAPTDHRADIANADSKNDFTAADCSPAGPVTEKDVNTEAYVNKDVQIDDADSSKSDQLPAVISSGDENVGLIEGSAVSQPVQQVSCDSGGAAFDNDGALPVEVKNENLVAMVREKSSIPGYEGQQMLKSDCKNKSCVLVTDSLPSVKRVIDRGTAIPSNHAFDPTLATNVDDKRFVQKEGLHGMQGIPASRASSENRSNTTRKTTSSASSGALEQTKGDTLMPDVKPVDIARVEVKIEEGFSDAGTRMSTADNEAESGHDVQSVCVVSLPQEEVAEGLLTPVSTGSHRSGFRTSGSFAASLKFSGVVLPWEKERDPNVLAATEKHKAELLAKAKRAKDDYVIEEAEIIKARRKEQVELAERRAPIEPSRRKSHWDFVLAEMAWMANDFMQERLWKKAAATQFCRWIAEIKGNPNYVQDDLVKTQKRISLVVSTYVMEFWRSVELAMVKKKNRSSSTAATNQAQGNTVIVKEELGAGPMDVDMPAIKEVKKQLLIREKSPVQEYAKRIIKSSTGLLSSCQAEAPCTPERISECSAESEPVWGKFPKGPLSYVVPAGAFAAYRSSVEAQWAQKEAKCEQEHAAALAEAEAQAAAQAVAASDAMTASVNDDQPVLCLLSPQVDVGADEDGPQYGLPHSSIAKKKRKNLLKSSPKVDGTLPSLLSRPSPSIRGIDNSGSTLPSPLVTGKRSLPAAGGIPGSAGVGSIPTKRMRSRPTRQRSLGGTNSPSAFPTAAGGLLNRIGFSSAALNPNHEDINNAADGSYPARTDDDDTIVGKNLVGIGNSNSFGSSKSSKKKKKTKPFGGNLGSSVKADGGASSPVGAALKSFEGEPHSAYEQLKRKGDQFHGVTHDAFGAGSSAETPETPASQGQPASKKLKLSKPASDISPDIAAAAAAAVPATQGGSMVSNTSSANKLIRQNSNRDRNRKGRSNKVSVSQPAGIGIPWSPIEDQAILALVHDLGPNWELVSDVLSSSSQLKGIFRRPKQCKERHKAVMERLAVEGGDSPEDPSSSQAPHPGIPKGSARHLLQRLQGPMEEDTLKIHLEQIVRIYSKHRAQKPQNGEPKSLIAPHLSHVNIMSQYCNSGATGTFPNPLELCDPNPPNHQDLGGPTFPPPGPHLPPGILPAGSGMRPASTSMPSTPNTNSMHMGAPAMAPSNVAVNAARDVHRLVRPLTPDDRARYAARVAMAAAARGLSVPGSPVTATMPMMAMPNPNEGAVQMLPAGNGVGMMGGLTRGMSLSRVGLPVMKSPVGPGMASPQLGNMLSPGGVGMVGAGSSMVVPPGVPNQVLLRRQREQMVRQLQSGRATEEQRQMIIQELQHQAAQGSAEAQTTLNSLNREIPAPMIAQAQNFGSPHPTHQQQQFLAARQKQLQQHQKQQRLMQQHQLQQQPATHPMQMQQQQQLHNMVQHVLPQQAHMAQHPHALAQPHVLQKQAQGSPHPSSPVQAMGSPTIPLSHHQSLSQSQPQSQHPSPSAQVPQITGPAKGQQSKHSQKHQHALQSSQAVHQQQQQAPRSSKGVVRGNMIMQPTGQVNMLQGPVAIGNQLPGQSISHSMAGQRSLQPQVSMAMVGKQSTQGTPQGQQSQMQSQQIQPGLGAGLQQKSLQQSQQVVLPSKQQQQPSSQQPSPTAGLSPQQQQLSPTSQPTQHSPSQQPQAQTQPQSRRQPQQQQPQLQSTSQRRLQQRQAGMNGAGQPGKNTSAQQVSQIAPQLPSQPGHVGFQLGTNLATSMTMVPVVAPLGNSSPSGMHPAQWKSGQNASSIPSGMYNMTRGGTTGAPLIAPIVNSAGMHMTPLNGTNSTSNPVMHAVSVGGGAPQLHQPMQVGSGSHAQKGGNGSVSGSTPGTNSRSLGASSQGGAQRPAQQNNPPSSHAGNASGQGKPAANSAPSSRPISPSSSGTSAATSPAATAPTAAPQSGSTSSQGNSTAAAGLIAPVTSSGPTYGVQPRQSTAATANSGPSKAVAPTVSNGTGNDVSNSKPALVTPLTSGANPTVADQTTS